MSSIKKLIQHIIIYFTDFFVMNREITYIIIIIDRYSHK